MRTLALQGKSRPLDYSFKVEKSSGGHGKQDKKFIKNYKKLFVVLNEEGTVVSWESTDFFSQDKIEPVLNDVKFKLKNNQITYIYTDTRCSFSNVYEQYYEFQSSWIFFMQPSELPKFWLIKNTEKL